MQSTTDFLSDAAFFQEAVDFLDMNCFSPTSLSFNEDEMLAIPEIIETTSNILSPRSSDTSADSSERDRAFVALKTYREKEKLRRRKQRQRIRDELESMRRKEDELSRLLKKMKLHKETRLSSGEQHSIWKEVALTQRDQRLKSETEQRRLITTVKDQASYIKQLRGLFHTHQNLPSFMNALGTSALSGGIASQLGASDVPVFTSLLQAIDASCASFDDIMNGCGVVAMSLGIVNSTHWNSGSGELEYYQKLHKFEEPFDFEKTHRSCWKAFNYQHHQCDRKTYSGLGNTENTIAIKYRLVRKLTSGTTVSVVQRLVARRFIEQNRVLGIWKTYTEGEGVFRGMHSSQTGWSCVRPLSDRPGALGEVCIRQFPAHSNTSPMTTSEFHGFLHAAVNENRHEMMNVVHKQLHNNVM